MKYYLNLNSKNLAHYINNGIIISSRFYINRTQDIQSNIGDYILLCKEAKYLNGSDMIIRINLSTEDEVNLEKIENEHSLFLYKNPISIVAIDKIVTTANKKDIILNITLGSGFINENIFLAKNIEASNTKDHNFNFKYSNELENLIKKFDSMLGASALLHLNNSQTIDLTKSIDNYIYEKTLKERIDESCIEEEAKKENIDIKNKQELGKYIYSEISEKNSNTYLLMILFNYINKASIDIFINDYLHNKFKETMNENIKLKILIYYGANQGYSKLKYKYENKKLKFDFINDKVILEKIYNSVFKETEVVASSEIQEIVKEDSLLVYFIGEIKNVTLASISTIPEKISDFFSEIKKTHSEEIEKLKVNHSNVLSGKDEEIQKLHDAKVELESLKAKDIEDLKVSHNKDLSAKDEEIKALKENYEKLDYDLSKVNEDQELYKKKVELDHTKHTSLSKNNLDKLKIIAKEKGIKFSSNIKKDDLIKLIDETPDETPCLFN